MENLQPRTRTFLVNGLGYVAGAVVGYPAIYLLGQFGLVDFLFNLVEEGQTFLQLLAIPLIAWFMLALGGMITGGIGGWILSSSIGTENRGKIIGGSSVAFAGSTGILIMLFLILTSFIALYNNLSTGKIEQFGILFGLYGLVFGLLTGLFQAFTTVRLRHTWRVILASTLGFAAGGILAGLIIRWINPLDGLETSPILTTLLLLLALALPYFIGGGALGLAYLSIARRTVEAGEEIETAQSPIWQIAVVGLIALFIIIPVLNLVDKVAGFLTIQPANLQSQITSETTGVRWSDPVLVAGGGENYGLLPAGSEIATVAGTEIQAWCSPDGLIQFDDGSGNIEQIDFPSCISSPAAALDADGIPHLVWYTTEIRDTNGVNQPTSLLVESARKGGEWSEPVIAGRTAGDPLFSLADDGEGNLVIVWADAGDSSGDVFISAKEQYECSEEDLNPAELAGLKALLGGNTRPEGAQVPFCRNEYDRIIYLPNPDPSYSDLPATQNGGFDQVSDLVEQAEYEVLFNVMQWVETEQMPSPGSILAESIATLYQQVKTNPDQYPRGMTVRILLGNYPVVADFTWGSQIIGVIKDLKAAGIDKMVDPAIGWRVEVANYPGVYPHSHNKMVVVDGKTAGALGFNYSYIHFAKDHPSGEGDDLFEVISGIVEENFSRSISII